MEKFIKVIRSYILFKSFYDYMWKYIINKFLSRLNLQKIDKNYHTFDFPTFYRVAKACLFSEERETRSKSINRIFPTPALAKANAA